MLLYGKHFAEHHQVKKSAFLRYISKFYFYTWYMYCIVKQVDNNTDVILLV